MKELRKILDANPLISAVMRRAKRTGVLHLQVTGSEKWNQPSWDEATEQYSSPEVPRENGLFDVEGHVWTDINGFYSVRLWHPRGIATFLRSLWSWLKDVVELRSLEFAIETNPFRRVWSNWVWVLESFDVVRSDMADEMIEIEVRNGYEAYAAEHARLTAALTDAQVYEYLSKHYTQISTAMWVSQADPTVIVVNNGFPIYSYDLKDGWSDKMMASLVGEWAEELYGFSSKPVLVVNELKTFSPSTYKVLSAIRHHEKWMKSRKS